MVFWDFVKDVGKFVFGFDVKVVVVFMIFLFVVGVVGDFEMDCKVVVFKVELKVFGLILKEVYLMLCGGDMVIVKDKEVDDEMLEKLILVFGNIKGIVWVELVEDLDVVVVVFVVIVVVELKESVFGLKLVFYIV